MKQTLLLTLPAIAVSLVSIAASVSAAEDAPGAFYLGGALGTTDYDDDGFYDQQRLDDSEYGLKAYGGYRFNQYVSVEAALTSLGNYEAESLNADIETDFGAITGSIVGHLPLGAGFSLFGQVGIGSATISQDITFATGGGVLFSDDDEDDADSVLAYGFGLNYIPPALQRIQFRLGWERYDFSLDSITVNNGVLIKDDVDHEIELIHFGAAYNF